MIPVAPQPEPKDFDVLVRAPGSAFLAINPTPTNTQIKRAQADYWRRCLPQLKAAYLDICAYSAVWIPARASVDHFLPKSSNYALAYEWSNYRLADQIVNQRKDNSLGVQDPFLVQPGWFVIDFDSLCIGCGAALRPDDESRVRYTIELLKLNADDELVEQRRTVVEQYARGAPLADVERYYPFIASELKRQDLTETIKLRFQP